MNVATFLHGLEARGVRVRVSGGELVVRGSPNAMFQQPVLAELRARRAEILDYFRRRPHHAEAKNSLHAIVAEWKTATEGLL